MEQRLRRNGASRRLVEDFQRTMSTGAFMTTECPSAPLTRTLSSALVLRAPGNWRQQASCQSGSTEPHVVLRASNCNIQKAEEGGPGSSRPCLG